MTLQVSSLDRFQVYNLAATVQSICSIFSVTTSIFKCHSKKNITFSICAQCDGLWH